MSIFPTDPVEVESMTSLQFISGSWIEEAEHHRCEEVWSTADGDTLMGMFRWISSEEVSFYEFMVIKVTDAGAELHVKHFHPTLVAWEEKERFQAFILTDLQPNRVVFAAVQDPDESEVTGGWLTYELTDRNHLEVCIIEASGNVKLNFHFERET